MVAPQGPTEEPPLRRRVNSVRSEGRLVLLRSQIQESSGKGAVELCLAPAAFGADQLTCTNTSPELCDPEQGPCVRDKQLPCRGAVRQMRALRADLNLSLREARTAKHCGGSRKGTEPMPSEECASWCKRDVHTPAVQIPEQPRGAQMADTA